MWGYILLTGSAAGNCAVMAALLINGPVVQVQDDPLILMAEAVVFLSLAIWGLTKAITSAIKRGNEGRTKSNTDKRGPN